MNREDYQQRGLYDPAFEHDACGIGAVVDIKGRQSYETVDSALKIVEKLEHRAGKDAEGKTGDGVGILLQISHQFFQKAATECGIQLGEARDYGVGMFFFPQDTLRRNQAKKMFEVIVAKEGMEFLGWRKVPVCPEVLGQKALSKMPNIQQAFVKRPGDAARGLEFDRRLYVARRVFEQSNDNTYVPSLSSRTVVYKGMFLVGELRKFYLDLQSRDYHSAIACVHSRFSTNTNPSWERAHPNRLILHNGEINTIRGNADRMLAREETMSNPVIDDALDKIYPVVNGAGSDSAMLDNTLEFLVMSGMDLPLAVMVTIPEPWTKDGSISRAKRDLYQYYAIMMEPWDGPASILFSDGDAMGAVLDRNGLRPSRYYITDDGKLILSSEVGALDLDPRKIVKKSRLEPGKMLLVDTVQGRIIDDAELKETYAARQPYGEWLDRGLIRLKDLPVPNKKVPGYSQEELTRLEKAFGYTYEDVKNTILPMARTGAEPTAAMGVDIPLAVLSDHEQPLFNYFKQLFAQVTNPPIDAIREEVVTDTTVYLGNDGNLLEERADNAHALQVGNPILTSVDLMKIRGMKQPGFQVETVSILYYKNTPLKRALDHLFVAVDRAYRNGANIVILSDRGVDENHVAIPSLLAVSAVERYLIRTKKCTAVSIVLESAEPRDVNHFATLLGYGARAVNPYLAHAAIGSLIDQGLLDKDYHTAVKDYNQAILSGIVKIASKMGISTIQSYQSAQIFEAVGIDRVVVDEYFTGTLSRVGGVGLKEIAQLVDDHHSRAFDPLGLGGDPTLDSRGEHKARAGQEDHMYSPQVIHLLQEATRRGDYKLFKEYTALVDDASKPHTLRGLMEMQYLDTPIPLDEVESVDSIVKRFKTGAMSFGSISAEAHECMAVAMNTLGGKSNCGEGGEDPARFGTLKNSAIKQVASGRFGVTSEYLVSAQDIQIKMAQGAKPGEGGHLPGKKITPEVARTRHSTPGVTLISPPPHHDIYSIEDLAQLIYDLKNANRQARISVKLCAEPGVGTIASGVAKAGAQVVLICGYDGGTGAAPRSSIHSAGVPWELGVAETHQTLIMNGLRSRVIVETDGKLMSGRDVAIACMLGAEEFGFATAPLVTMGCCMMRVCNLGTCPAGIATQDPELRRRFTGKPEYVMNFMRFVAQELREHMACLGVRTVDELVGRTDLLKVREHAVNERAATVDLSAILDNPFEGAQVKRHFDPADAYDFQLEKTVDMRVLLKKMKGALEKGEKRTVNVPVTSTDRTLGTIFGSDITRLHGSSLPDDTFTVKCTGGGGQSFGAFIPKGLTLELEGDCNDYMGKGLSGGKIIVYPPKGSPFKPEENIIIGNVALYGATSGKAFINGMAGERFAVRNSGACAVVEGVGDHGCEYMTGGRVVVLGPTGKNFAAGMSGGIAYVWDEDRDLYLRLNKALVTVDPVTERQDIQEIRTMLTEHVEATGSPKAREILDHLEEKAACFKKILPRDYDRMLRTIAEFEAQGLSHEQAEVEAFSASTKE
ncbi:glutamate synthase large subunit [Clostridium sp. DFI.5.61]|uniref:glutamate synthase large subunit n=1 Tax=Clostridium sp. DFI.5.61 TaxID=2965279 RepID=UPI00210E8298|nr:glutamate synthase large subunit [Clostridium sp. DFI.5.61]MCB5924557.1 glutamate synthase large subunit [bacterium 210820-DFI.5.26]MCQ5160050.1 glutamate synthase large subunit [Clostridium sp. DFI.5.61]